MGIVYALTNKAMPGLVKIGITDDADLRAGMGPLFSDGVFEVVYACRVENALEVERSLHVAFDTQRISTTPGADVRSHDPGIVPAHLGRTSAGPVAHRPAVCVMARPGREPPPPQSWSLP